jgi:hypothetical protein
MSASGPSDSDQRLCGLRVAHHISSTSGHKRLLAAGDAYSSQPPQYEDGNHGSVGRREVPVDDVLDHRQRDRCRETDYRLSQCTDSANRGFRGPGLEDANNCWLDDTATASAASRPGVTPAAGGVLGPYRSRTPVVPLPCASSMKTTGPDAIWFC